MLFDFDIKYRTGKLNKTAEALSHHCYVQGEMHSDSDSEEYETSSYTTVCDELEEIADGDKLSIECKVAIQNKQNNFA